LAADLVVLLLLLLHAPWTSSARAGAAIVMLHPMYPLLLLHALTVAACAYV